MKVFVAGATGVIGRPLVRRLLDAGHQVTAMTRVPERADALEALGAQPALCDVFEPDEVYAYIGAAEPDAVVHQLTSIPSRIHPRRIAAEFAVTNRLRTEGTRNLLHACRAHGVKRFVAQSIAFAYIPSGNGLKREEDPLFLDAPAAYRPLVEAVHQLEQQATQTAGVDGVALRYGFFYGAGTIYAPDGTFASDVRKRGVPLIGPGSGIFSFVHADDAAAATVCALERGATGIYNVVDDDPAPVGAWLPAYAAQLGAPRPRRVPRWLARIVAGSYAVTMFCEMRGASNEAAKRDLGWTPQRASWRQGFPEMLESATTASRASGEEVP